ncbi:hypothetical protein ACROYT_G016062 [Oculina patagonica]
MERNSEFHKQYASVIQKYQEEGSSRLIKKFLPLNPFGTYHIMLFGTQEENLKSRERYSIVPASPMVFVSPEDWGALCYLWWSDGDLTKDLKNFQMLVHLFRATSSPSICGHAKRKTTWLNWWLLKQKVAFQHSWKSKTDPPTSFTEMEATDKNDDTSLGLSGSSEEPTLVEMFKSVLTELRDLKQTASPLVELVYEDERDDQFTLNGWPHHCQDVQLQPYLRQKAELTIEGRCALWGNRVIVPPQGAELHETYPGKSRIKALACGYVWWPNMDCYMYLVVIDVHFKWMDVHIIQSTTELCIVLGTNLPTTRSVLTRKLLKIDRDNFQQYVVCPKCTKLYHMDEIVINDGRQSVARTCNNVPFPRARQPWTCGSQLAQVSRRNGSIKFYALKIYCYKKIIDFLKTAEECEKWKTRTMVNAEIKCKTTHTASNYLCEHNTFVQDARVCSYTWRDRFALRTSRPLPNQLTAYPRLGKARSCSLKSAPVHT